MSLMMPIKSLTDGDVLSYSGPSLMNHSASYKTSLPRGTSWEHTQRDEGSVVATRVDI